MKVSILSIAVLVFAVSVTGAAIDKGLLPACKEENIGTKYTFRLNPRKYLECTERGLRLKRCPRGEFFYSEDQTCVADEDGCDKESSEESIEVPVVIPVHLYRYYNEEIVDHFYTTNWNELGDGDKGWSYEGVAGQVYQSQVEGTVPLLRYWNVDLGDHFYTVDKSELGQGKDGYVVEGIAGYIAANSGPHLNALLRYYNADKVDHFYTTSSTELGDDGKDGYVYEGVGGYVL